MSLGELDSIFPRLMPIIARHLQALRESIDGGELYGIIARTLRKHARTGPIAEACISELHRQLDNYARDALTLPPLRIKARLLQQHLSSYLTADRSAIPTPSVAAPAAPEVSATKIVEGPNADIEEREHRLAQPSNVSTTPLTGVLERPQTIAQERTAKYQALLRSEKDAWQAIYGTLKDFNKLKQAWMSTLDELAHQRTALEQKLQTTTAQLATLETERERLLIELEKARNEKVKKARLPGPTRIETKLLSMRHGLLKREVFLAQLGSEIKRVRRSGSPLAFALLSVAGLAAIKESHGEGAAEAVNRCYEREILTNFRAYDLVARYADDKFAVLFPDTRKESALRALEKARKRAAETHLSHERAPFRLPIFTSAMTLYSMGEDTTSFLVRAERALHKAENSGGNQIAAA